MGVCALFFLSFLFALLLFFFPRQKGRVKLCTSTRPYKKLDSPHKISNVCTYLFIHWNNVRWRRKRAYVEYNAPNFCALCQKYWVYLFVCLCVFLLLACLLLNISLRLQRAVICTLQCAFLLVMLPPLTLMLYVLHCIFFFFFRIMILRFFFSLCRWLIDFFGTQLSSIDINRPNKFAIYFHLPVPRNPNEAFLIRSS